MTEANHLKKKSEKCIFLIAVVLLLLLTAVVTAILSLSKKPPVSQTVFGLDTVCTITLYEWSGDGDQLLTEAFALCHHYETMLSTTVSESDIFKINHSHGKPVTVSPETAALLTDALTYCQMSGGKFDVTVYPVKQLWDFSGNSSVLPNRDALNRALRLVNYREVLIDGNSVTLPNGYGIDLGAIAKGFITDKIAAYLQSRHVSSAVIDLGGNIRVIGTKPDGHDWNVGIQRPFDSDSIATVQTADKAVVTSGIYQRYFTSEGRIYHHILDPATGMPCDTGLSSVTIVAPSAKQADALSTVCMLLGYEESCRLLQDFPNVQAYFITRDIKILSPEMQLLSPEMNRKNPQLLKELRVLTIT